MESQLQSGSYGFKSVSEDSQSYVYSSHDRYGPGIPILLSEVMGICRWLEYTIMSSSSSLLLALNTLSPKY